jgi:hypothetical protein
MAGLATAVVLIGKRLDRYPPGGIEGFNPISSVRPPEIWSIFNDGGSENVRANEVHHKLALLRVAQTISAT